MKVEVGAFVETIPPLAKAEIELMATELLISTLAVEEDVILAKPPSTVFA